MKKSVKTIIIVCIIFTFIFGIEQVAYGSQWSSVISTVNGVSDSTKASTIVSNGIVTIMAVVKIAAVCIAIVMILALAMKYMTAAPSEKAEIKKSAIVYVVGAIVLFGVSGILTIIEKFASVISMP